MAAVTIRGEGPSGKWFGIRTTVSNERVWFDYVQFGRDGKVKRGARQHLLGVKVSRARQLAEWILDHTEE